MRLPKSSSMTTHLKSLHWLPVKVRSTYKTDCMFYHCPSSTAPSYVTDIINITPATHAPAHPPCHLSIDLHNEVKHSVIARYSAFSAV